MKNRFLYCLCYFLFVNAGSAQLEPLQQVNFSQVNITDNFWKPKLEKLASTTLGACIYQTEQKTGRIRNFEKAARRKGEQHEGIYYDDNSVFKLIEAIAYSLKNYPDEKLEKKGDEWIDKIAAAQLPDGYLHTYYILTGIDKRWTDMSMHEDYTAGNLIEAAVAYHNTTGKRKLLDVAIRFADHIDSTFRLQNRPWVSGHEEIELALMKLYRITGNDRYLKLADWFLDQRGRGYGKGETWNRPNWGAKYCQDDVPVKQQKEITGHAVRAMYLYSGAADVAAATKDTGYLNAMENVWQDVVYRNMYVTGGIGSSGRNEGFSVDYDLPNENAYCETCASVGMVFWNHRMGMLTGNSKYIDVLEKSLYNGALSGLSLSGDRFFYGNPLASNGQHSRSEWFGTACCPSNIARLVASLGNYIYAKSDNRIWVNLFVGSNTNIKLQNGDVSVQTNTDYPWNGKVNISVSPQKQQRFTLHVRIPGWAKGNAVPGDLYSFATSLIKKVSVTLNGAPVDVKEENGYFILDRTWKKGDVISVDLPMDIQKVNSHPGIKGNTDKVALQRGPVMYCVEGADNKNQAWNFILPASAELKSKPYTIANEPVIAIEVKAPVMSTSSDGLQAKTELQQITAVPYYTWANRGSNPMQVWLPTKIKEVKINY